MDILDAVGNEVLDILASRVLGHKVHRLFRVLGIDRDHAEAPYRLALPYPGLPLAIDRRRDKEVLGAGVVLLEGGQQVA